MIPAIPDDGTCAPNLVLSRDEVRSIDAAAVRELGLPGLLLMENAARGVSDHLIARSDTDAPVILCGPGNNGGDGLAVARQRAARGLLSRVVLVTAGKTLSDDTRANLDFLQRTGILVETVEAGAGSCDVLDELTPRDHVVDGLLGTGLRGAAREPFDVWIEAINQSAAKVLSIDIPSGMDCDSGTAAGVCVEADITVTFVAKKKGFVNPLSRQWTGDVSVEHIGIPLRWIEQWIRDYRVTGGGASGVDDGSGASSGAG